MAVTFDVQDGPSIQNGVSSNTLSTLTVGSGANRGLVAVISFNSAATISTVVWDDGGTNQAMTLVAGPQVEGAGSVAIYGLANPISGTKNLKVTFSGNTDSYLAAVAYTGVDQTGGTTSFPNGNTAIGTDAAPTVTITSAANDAVVGALMSEAIGINSVNNTQVYLSNGGASVNGAANRAGGAASVIMSGVLAATGNWAMAGVDVLAGGAVTPITAGFFIEDTVLQRPPQNLRTMRPDHLFATPAQPLPLYQNAAAPTPGGVCKVRMVPG